ncbi:unnamed protein product [Cyberlindnera jadinii]|uniref:Uncharacterized protein n=1 Tax=Cyberlindnera jadinii (strain ATCC 18201 / CBS 1600 / BCRC 20928 / JCM 3617 / NBRC 0987 / NRRL Y-1542) TaxID=983966 RepID=A0A0H5C622_CYBJN|nr:hypothetical protein CYBJADRAFT_167680 [Cyberlindnera jadinii NRRL Y-1542]ODV73657.1 hypothetical protein CYBJADRAFT_167680 [Cyberlindnera jadinii NRRL Y-1542]CEP23481.1 unnamed protein product [Cyberlindnera jadinii]
MSRDSQAQLAPIITSSAEDQATGAVYQVIKDFSARLADELSLRVGDKVEVISDDKEYNDGWYMGKSLSTGAVGLYPKSFTQIVPSLSRPSLLRSRSRRLASPVSSQQSPVAPSKNVLGTPTAQKNGRLEDFDLHDSPTAAAGNTVSNALSDIDKALEELRTEAGNSEDKRTSFSTESKETLNPESVESWTPEQVASYFRYLGFEDTATQFAKHKITGAILLELELAYLKELDISSFGTRFEIFKEIEALKELSKQKKYDDAKSLQAAPDLYRGSLNIEDTRPLGHMRKKSRSLDDIPELRQSHSLDPTVSQILRPASQKNPPRAQVPDVPTSPLQDQFLSPRRAPQPPSFPSPFREQKSVAQSSPIPNKRASTMEGHSRKPSYDISPNFQTTSHSRNGSRNLKSASVADLSHRDRPASSIYMDPHSRQSSVNIRGHSRNSSEGSVLRAEKDGQATHHRRNSSLFSFLSPSKEKSRRNSVIHVDSPTKAKTLVAQDQQTPTKGKSDGTRSVSAKEREATPGSPSEPAKRSVSEAVRAKTLRHITTAKKSTKKTTSAFMEGIKDITPEESMLTATCSGWMSKRGGIAVGVWKQRFFVLHGTRLSYFTSLEDTRERGLIDITSHKVLPAKDDDKLVSLYAASTGHGKFCFKLVPPAPGTRKGLTFTQPKVHYFAVDTKDEMRSWMAALIKATIDIDESVPVLSSCATPTVSLQKAQSLLAQARENVKKRDDLLKSRDNEQQSGTSSGTPDSYSFDSNVAAQQSPNTTATTSEMTPVVGYGSSGFASPYDIAAHQATKNSPVSSPTTSTQSAADSEFKSTPYSGGPMRNPSQKVISASQAAAQAALGKSNSTSSYGGKI